MSWLDSIGQTISGTVDADTQNQLAQGVKPVDQSAYQLQGLGGYQNTMQGLSGQLPGANDYTTPNAADMGNQAALQSYFQNVAMGRGQTASDQMFQNAQQSNARQMQSAMVSQPGMNPALAQRQMANSQAATQGTLAGQSAQHKLQEQQAYGQMAQQGSQAMVQQRMQQLQQNYMEQMNTSRARQDIAQGIFNSQRDQTNLNVDYAKNQQAYQTFQYQAQLQAKKDEAASHAALLKTLMGAGTAAAGAGMMAFGGPAAGMAGMGMMSGGLGMMGGGGGGGGGMNPYVMQMLAQGQSGPALPGNSAASNGVPLQQQYGNTYGGMTGSADFSGYRPRPDATGYGTGAA